MGNLSLDLGVNTKIKAKLLSIKKNNILILESEEFDASVSLSKILAGRFDINSLSLKNSKLYGLNIDESIIKSYNLLAGRNYNINNTMYSEIELIEAKGYFQDDILQIKDIGLTTELLKGEGFGKIKPSNETINVSATTSIRTNENIKKHIKLPPATHSESQPKRSASGFDSRNKIDSRINEKGCINRIVIEKEMRNNQENIPPKMCQMRAVPLGQDKSSGDKINNDSMKTQAPYQMSKTVSSLSLPPDSSNPTAGLDITNSVQSPSRERRMLSDSDQYQQFRLFKEFREFRHLIIV